MIQRLNRLAESSLLDRTREYRPDSLMMVMPRFGISKVAFSDLSIICLSSVSTWDMRASLELLYPSASATSFPTNHGERE